MPSINFCTTDLLGPEPRPSPDRRGVLRILAELAADRSSRRLSRRSTPSFSRRSRRVCSRLLDYGGRRGRPSVGRDFDRRGGRRPPSRPPRLRQAQPRQAPGYAVHCGVALPGRPPQVAAGQAHSPLGDEGDQSLLTTVVLSLHDYTRKDHVERTKRLFRFLEKVRYKWRRRRTLVRFVVMTLDRVWRDGTAAETKGAEAPKPVKTDKTPTQASQRSRRVA